MDKFFCSIDFNPIEYLPRPLNKSGSRAQQGTMVFENPAGKSWEQWKYHTIQ